MTRRAFTEDLRQLQNQVLHLSSMVDKAIGRSVEALQTQNIELAEQVNAGDDAINAARWEIEETTIEMIARQAGFEGDATQLQQIGTQMIAEFLNAEGGLVAQEFAANADAAMASVESALQVLNQLNLESNLAATLANSSSQQVASNLQAQAQARANSASLGLDFLDFLFPVE